MYIFKTLLFLTNEWIDKEFSDCSYRMTTGRQFTYMQTFLENVKNA